MSDFVLTTHADCNPLVAALRQEGVVVERVTWPMQLGDLNGCLGLYGNLFDEIKDWSGLLKLRHTLRHACVPYVFWNRDAPWNVGMKCYNRWALRLIKPVDVYLAHSRQDAAWFGGTAHYFPNAAQPAYYETTNLAALRDESSYQYDVSFFGSIGKGTDSNTAYRRAFLLALQNELTRKVPQVRMHVVDIAYQTLTVQAQIDLIRTSKINLNVGAMCDLPNNPSWGLPERVFGIPAAGGLLISDVRKHIADSFAPDILPVFDSPQRCAALIEHLLGDWGLQRTLAEKQHHEVFTRHTYQQRARTLVDYLQHYRTSARVAV